MCVTSGHAYVRTNIHEWQHTTQFILAVFAPNYLVSMPHPWLLGSLPASAAGGDCHPPTTPGGRGAQPSGNHPCSAGSGSEEGWGRGGEGRSRGASGEGREGREGKGRERGGEEREGEIKGRGRGERGEGRRGKGRSRGGEGEDEWDSVNGE